MADTYGSPGLFYGGPGTYGDWADTPTETASRAGILGKRLPRPAPKRRVNDDEELLLALLL
jgi:hypothetical protein